MRYEPDALDGDVLRLPRRSRASEDAASFVARFIRYAERMEEFGPDLGMPHTRAMGAGLFELRLKSPDGTARVFYCIARERRIVILHHFAKKSAKTPAKELLVARRRLKEVAR